MLPKQEPVGLLIAAVRRRIQQVVGAEARRHGLSSQQFWILLAVHRNKGLSLGELAGRLRMDQPTASRIIASLARRKLLRIETDAADRRRAVLMLTARGAGRAGRLQPLAGEVRRAVVAGFAGAEQRALRRFLRRILGNLDRFGARRARRLAKASMTWGGRS